MKAYLVLASLALCSCNILQSSSSAPIKGDLDRTGAARLLTAHLAKTEPEIGWVRASYACGQEAVIIELERLGYLRSVVMNPGNCKFELTDSRGNRNQGRYNIEGGRRIYLASRTDSTT